MIRRGQTRMVLVLLHDVIISAGVMMAALILRYQFENKPIPDGLITITCLTHAAVTLTVFWILRLYRSVWRYTTMADILRLGRAVILAQLVTLPVLFILTRLADFPRSVPLLAGVGTWALLSFSRAAVQVLHSGQWRLFSHRSAGLSALLIGTGAEIDLFLQHQATSPDHFGLRAIGFLSSDSHLQGRQLRGLKGLGPPETLPEHLASLKHQNSGVIVLLSLTDATAVQAAHLAAAEGISVLRPKGDGTGVEPLSAAELLTRPARRPDPAVLRRAINGQRVLITGAAGAIGGELARQIAHLSPAKLFLLDLSESGLFTMGQQIPAAELILADVRDDADMRRIFAASAPDLVLHAAAIKHVPMAEHHPVLTTHTNVGGTLSSLRAAHAANARFVLISTDKAVQPTGVMGASKALAERLTLAFAAAHRAEASFVRFGNVLGSSGSVVPHFEAQIASGGPITLTDPDMTRYFMTLGEAAGLVIQAATLPSRTGYVLDMGPPVSILDLARRLIALHGLRPGIDIAITATGIRPGEKLHEALHTKAESPAPTSLDGVLRLTPHVADWAEVNATLTALTDAISRHDGDAVKHLLFTAPARQPEPA